MMWFLLFLFTLGANGDMGDAESPLRVRVIAGSLVREIDNILLYTSTSPLLYEFHFNFTEFVKVDLGAGECKEGAFNCEALKHIGSYSSSTKKTLEMYE